jgi:hypothetical protein
MDDCLTWGLGSEILYGYGIHVELLRIKDWSVCAKSMFRVCAGVELDASILIDDERNELTLFEGDGVRRVKYEKHSPWILQMLWVLVDTDHL